MNRIAVSATTLRPAALEHLPQRPTRIRFLVPVPVKSDRLEHRGEQRPQKRIVAVRHADDGASARLQHARHLCDGPLGFVEMLDRAHRIDRIEARVARRAGRGRRRRQPAGECAPGPTSNAPARLNRRSARRCPRRRRARPAAGPRQDARVLGLVPQVGLENPQAGERGEVLGEQPPLVVGVVARRRGAGEVGKALADARPEIAVAAERHG